MADPGSARRRCTASVLGMVIKSALGKLTTPDDLADQLSLNRFVVLDIRLVHAQVVGDLSPLHRDPFDRMLVAQARHEGPTLVTRDAQVKQYDVPWVAA